MEETPPPSSPDRSEEILRETVATLDALAEASSWEEPTPGILAGLGNATGVSRVYLYENLTLEDGRLAIRKRFEWTAPGLPVDAGDPESPDEPHKHGVAWHAEELGKGEVIHGPTRSFPPEEAARLAKEGVLSAAFVPVLVGPDWWGSIGYDDCMTEREWSVAEIESLRVFGRIFGSAIFRERLDAERRQAKAFLETHIANLPAVTYIEFTDTDSEHGYHETYVSPQVTEILGYSVEEWFDHSVLAAIHPDDRPAVDEETQRTARTGDPYYVEFRIRRKDGEWIWVRDQCHLIEDEPGVRPYWHGVMVDITEAKKMEEQIAFLAYHDPLTGLANRKLLAEMLEPALARAVRNDDAVAVLFMDLDNFKQINDTLGHDMGDLLLQQVTARLTEVIRDTDLVARQGGDEFLIMMPDIEPQGAGDDPDGRERAVRVVEAMAERIHKAMRLPFALGDTEVETSMSIGISLFPFDASDVRSLLKNSDAAMYRSKKSHSGGYALFAHTGTDPMVDLSFTNRLRQAVKDQPWVLHYQPMVSLESRRITGVEALLRWRKPKGDLVPADQFVPLAEEMGLLEIIGEWVLEELGRQMTIWAELGLVLDVSFNLSPRQLWQSDLASKLATAFDLVGADRSRVIVEVSESTATTDPGRSQRVLWAIHEQGFKLAIDDFGTGYTSPARLKHVPVDILKIDHPLTRDLPDDDDVGGFVEAVIRFAEDLGVVTLAEGIETEAQRSFLLDKGCKMGQGYLFSRPVDGHAIADLLR